MSASVCGQLQGEWREGVCYVNNVIFKTFEGKPTPFPLARKEWLGSKIGPAIKDTALKIAGGDNPGDALKDLGRNTVTSYFTPQIAPAGGNPCGIGNRLTSGGNCVRDVSFSPSTGGSSSNCPPGQRKVLGVCVNLPFSGAPGAGVGTVGTPAHTAYGEAVMGAFGIPALVPAQVGEINGAPIRRCPPGAVLGKDDLCYMKGSIPRQYRKWAPAAKPPVSAYDAKMMRKYGPGGSKQKRIKGLATDAGFSCKKK